MEVEFARSEVVFVGRVMQMSIEARTEDTYRHEVRVCRFQVLESFKGAEDAKKEIVIVTRMHGAACGFPFELGDRYLVYASSYRGEMETSVCRRTRALIQPKDAVALVPPLDPFAKVEMDEGGKLEAEQLRTLLKKR